MRRIFLTIIVFAIGLFVLNACNNVAKTNTNEAAKANQKDDQGHINLNVPSISIADAKKEFDAGNVVFVDTRGEVTFKQEHIKGAMNIPLETAETRYKEIPNGKKIIAYCSCPREQTSNALVLKLKEKGIENAFALVGGTQGWKSAGFPIEATENN